MANEKTYPNYLMHGRTKGSRNGISTTQGYTAVGQKARGRWVNGRYVYDNEYASNYAANTGNGTKTNKVQANTAPKRFIDDEYSKNLEYNSKKNAFSKKPRPSNNLKGALNNWQQQANAAASGKPSGYNNAHYNAVNQAAAERKAREAALARQKKASLRNAAAKGAQNSWQQTANKTAGILGNMSREDRSLMKSREWVSHDKNGKKQVNNGFNVNHKYGYSNYTKSDNGWHDIHTGEYNTTGVKGVKKQQDWNTSFERNHRSDIGNAIADAKEDAKKAFKEAKADAKRAFVNLKNKAKKKKKSLKDFFK